jgi:predicted  nucleic acid-binding Zn-ribbon protein
LKQAAKTLLWLQENGIDSYDDLKARASSVSGEVRRLTSEIREIETKQKDIADLQKQIGTYGKTRKVYETYRKSGWDSSFYEANRADITLHRAAKKYFDAQGLKGKLPPIATLKQEWATLESEKKLLYKDYYAVKPRHKELQTALMNADNLLRGYNLQEQERQVPKKSHDHGAR